MTTPYPVPASVRQTPVLLGNGSATYGPFGDGWGIFDLADVLAETRVAGTTGAFIPVPVTVIKTVPGNDYSPFTVTFSSALTDATEFRVRGRRAPNRSQGISRGSALDARKLELDLSKITVSLQELRRDIDNLSGDIAAELIVEAQAAADQAAASALTAQAAAASISGFLPDWAALFGTANDLILGRSEYAALANPPDGFEVAVRLTAANTGPMTIRLADELGAAVTPVKPLLNVNGAAVPAGQFASGDLLNARWSTVNDHWRLTGTRRSTDIRDSSAAGRSMLTAADAAAQTALLNLCTTALKGLMSSADKVKLNALPNDVVVTVHNIGLLSAGTDVAVNHGVSGGPDIAIGFIECVSAEQNWSVGEKLLFANFATSNTGLQFFWNATQVGFRRGSSGFTSFTAAGGSVVLTNGNWRAYAVTLKLT